jgi:outer membrane receptor protein involved in Fe transport
VPQVTITGMTAPFGDIFVSNTRLRTYEWRDTTSFERGKHLIRVGGELRQIFKGLSLAPPNAGSFAFASISQFAIDAPFRQTLTVNPNTGEPTNFPRYFHLREHGLFLQDDWKVTRRFTANLGVRHDYFGTVAEEHGLLSSIILGPGNTFDDQLASGAIGRVLVSITLRSSTFLRGLVLRTIRLGTAKPRFDPASVWPFSRTTANRLPAPARWRQMQPRCSSFHRRAWGTRLTMESPCLSTLALRWASTLPAAWAV